MELVMPFRNTCTICGKEIKQGDPVYAKNMDAVIAGKGMCEECGAPKPTVIANPVPAPEPLPIPPPEPMPVVPPEAEPGPIRPPANAGPAHPKPPQRGKR